MGAAIFSRYGRTDCYEFIEYKENWYYGLIFRHEFAKAIWGHRLIRVHQLPDIQAFIKLEDKSTLDILSKEKEIEEWQWHIQQMALSPDPLKYLEKFLL